MKYINHTMKGLIVLFVLSTITISLAACTPNLEPIVTTRIPDPAATTTNTATITAIPPTEAALATIPYFFAERVKVLPESGALTPLEEFENVCVEVPWGVSAYLESPPEVFFDNEIDPADLLFEKAVEEDRYINEETKEIGSFILSVTYCYSSPRSPGVHQAEAQFFEYMDPVVWTFTILEEALPTSTPEK
jgi:hypothetical protein